MMPNVVVLVSRCSAGKRLFGIRMEERGTRRWIVTWAFPVKESTATREGYDRTEIRGSFDFDEHYPGCPGCSARGLVLCDQCGKLGCWDTRTTHFRCPWCGSQGRVEGQVTKLKAGMDI